MCVSNIGRYASTISNRICQAVIVALSLIVSVSGMSRALDASSFTLSDGVLVSPLEQFRECEECPEMIVMPPGSFMMGAIPGESRYPFDIYDKELSEWRRRGPDEINIIPHEHPRHLVEMDIPYAIARNELTHAEWMKCVAAGGCSHNPDHRVLTPSGYVKLGPDHPVINVSYLDALEYAAWLNGLVGEVVYRLPTEAEWEYAARAGTTTRFAQGDNLTAEQANFGGSSTEHHSGMKRPDLVNRRQPVLVEELDAANAWGVRHMSGNVFELTLSCWTKNHLGLASDSEYRSHVSFNSPCRRVAKGGHYSAPMDTLRPSVRVRPTEDQRRDFYGFRLIRTLTE